jgi:hypothetical protein
MGLKIDEIATVGIVRAAKEMIEAHFEQVGRRRIAGNMPAEFTVGAIGPHDHGQRIPAQRGGKLFFDIEVSRIRRLLIDGDRIRVGRDIEARRCDTVGRRVGREPIEQVLSPFGTGMPNHAIERIEPFGGFEWVVVDFRLAQGKDRGCPRR